MNLRSSMSVRVSLSVCVCVFVCVWGGAVAVVGDLPSFSRLADNRGRLLREARYEPRAVRPVSLSRVCSFKSCLSRELALTFFGPSIHPSKRAERVTTIESGWVWDAKIVGFQHIPAIFFVQFHVLTFVFFPFFSALVVPLFLISCA